MTVHLYGVLDSIDVGDRTIEIAESSSSSWHVEWGPLYLDDLRPLLGRAVEVEVGRSDPCGPWSVVAIRLARQYADQTRLGVVGSEGA